MPKSVRYTADSVVFFQGDLDERVYILKAGRIVLRSHDIETGQETRDLVQTGEFFGVRSALGKTPREEDALVIADSEVVQFSVAEFEQLVSSNTRIIIKMLKVFSNQLRRIHAKVSSMLNQENTIDPEDGLHHSATFYFKNRQFDHASYIWRRYLELYPQGRYVEEIRKQLSRAERSAGAGSAGGGAASETAHGEAPEDRPDRRSRGESLGDAGKIFFDASTALANDRFDEAIQLFKQLLEQYPDDEEYALKTKFELGRSYFEKGDFAETIRHFTRLIQDVPRLPQMGEVLYYVGAAYGRSGNVAKAKTLLAKARSSADDEPALRRKIDKLTRELEG